MSKSFITAAVVIVSFGAGITFLAWNVKPDSLDFLAIIFFLFTGWYATKFKFGNISNEPKKAK